MSIAELISPEPPKPKALRALKKRRVYIPSTDDKTLELKRLVSQHVNWTKKSVALTNMSSDKKAKKDDPLGRWTEGDKIPCNLPLDVQVHMQEVSESIKRMTNQCAGDMEKCLREIPIYKEFLEEVFGLGPIVAAYLVANVDFEKATKPSNLIRYCGYAVVDGRLERRSGAPKALGGTGTYNSELRTRIFQMFSSMWRTKGEGTSKYLQIWRDTIHTEKSRPEYNAKTNKMEGVKGGANGHIFKKGWHKAARVFLEDLYIIGRTMKGLPVWPSFYASKLGYAHGGKICVNAPKLLTLEEAKALVGYVGKIDAVVGNDEEFEEFEMQE